MTFDEILDQAIALLQHRGRLTYRALRRHLELDDDTLEDVKAELIKGRRLAVDEDGEVLVWAGDTPAAAPDPGTIPDPLTYTPPYLAEKILTSRAAVEGERKQVTVLFADLKGSMELLAHRDPEEARQLLDPVLERMMVAVHRYEGTVNQVLGDGIMALFGAPIAHEDHAVRACYAALAIQESIQAYAEQVRDKFRVNVQIRVGLNSGEVVVRTIGNDLHMDYSAIGQTTHLAARMEQLATPGSILLTSETLRLAEGVAQVRPLGPTVIKGLARPMEIFELMGAGSSRTRFQILASRTLTRFVGRQAEFEAMRQAHERAGAGHGQLVAVMGEPGVGKTRLFYEFLSGPWANGWLVIESQAAPFGKQIPYHPVRELLKAYFQLEVRDDEARIREKVTARLEKLDEADGPILPAALALLDVPVDDAEWQSLDPPQRRQRTLDALKRLLLRESQVQPLVLVCENLHWFDTETQAFLDSLVDRLPTARILLLVNYRPEYQHPWGGKSYYTQLRLDPLLPPNAVALLQALLGDDPALDRLKQTLIDRTEGNPFFLEETVRTLVESEVVVGEPGAYRLAQTGVPMQVPATVQAVLAARMDRLPAGEKNLLQTASVIGKDVPFALLLAIADLWEETLRGVLSHLQAAEFLYETSLFPELEYTFKHALTQEVAYGSLLRERGRVLHAAIAEAIERLASDHLAEQVERLAYHAVRGEVWDKAAAYSRQAGDKALARSAYREAVGYYDQALTALARLPEQRETQEQAIDLRFALRSALLPSGDFVRMLACLREAEVLAEGLDDQRRLGQVSRLLSLHFWFMAEHDQAIAAGQRAAALASASGEVPRHALANLNIGFAYQARGDYRQAIDCFGQTRTSLDAWPHHERFGQVNLPAVTSRSWGAWGHAELGLFAEGTPLGEQGLQIAEAVAHPSSLMVALWGMGRLALGRGDLPRALSLLERALDICQEADLPLWLPMVAPALGGAYTLGGRMAEAVPLLTRATEQTTAMGTVVFQTLCRLSLGEAHMMAGQLDEARATADRSLALAREHHERGNQAYALRLLGEIAARRSPAESGEVEAHCRRALALAEELGMRPLQAHCQRSLGAHYVQTGSPEAARVALTTALTLYRDMEMTFWIPQGEALLAQST